MKTFLYDFNVGNGHVICTSRGDTPRWYSAHLDPLPDIGERVMLHDGEGNSAEANVVSGPERNKAGTCWIFITNIDFDTWKDA